VKEANGVTIGYLYRLSAQHTSFWTKASVWNFIDGRENNAWKPSKKESEAEHSHKHQFLQRIKSNKASSNGTSSRADCFHYRYD